jgi:hypothetical protein
MHIHTYRLLVVICGWLYKTVLLLKRKVVAKNVRFFNLPLYKKEIIETNAILCGKVTLFVDKKLL